MKWLLFVLIVLMNISFALAQEDCITDLSEYKNFFEGTAVSTISKEHPDAEGINTIKPLLKSCVSKTALQTIRDAYFRMQANTTEIAQEAILYKLLKKHSLLCIDFQTPNNFIAALDELIKDYEKLKFRARNVNKNTNTLKQMRQLMSNCTSAEALRKIKKLNDEIITETFGIETDNFKKEINLILLRNEALLATKDETTPKKVSSTQTDNKIASPLLKTEQQVAQKENN